jgi:hypothetical protein
MLIYRGKLVSGPTALRRLVLRELIYENIFLGPVSVNDGTVARLINEPNGGLRMETWKTSVGWIEAPKGSMSLADFMPGAMRPVSADLASRVGMPAAELDDITPGERSPRARAKIIGLIKTRAWDLAVARCPPGHA